MKGKIYVLFLFFCILAAMSPVTVQSAEKEKYILSYNGGDTFHRLVMERTRAAYARAGLSAEFIALPHNRALLSANEGTVDGDVGRVPSVEEKYPNLRRVNVEVMQMKGAVYTNNPQIKVFTPELLTKYRVGHVLGIRWAEKKMQGLSAIKAPSYLALFEMLRQGRIDIALASEFSADAAMRNLKITQAEHGIRQLQPFVVPSPIYHYLHKENAAIIPRLEQAIREINSEGALVFYTGVPSPLLEILAGRLREALLRTGRHCEVRSTGSAQRALLLANEQGDGDAIRVPHVKELVPEQTANLLQIPEPIISIDLYNYSYAADMPFAAWDSLAGKRNGLRTGSTILEKNIPGEQVRLPSSERLFQMLAEKRLDTVTEHGVIADFIIKKNAYVGIIKQTPALASFSGHSYLHRKHADLIPSIVSSLQEMKRDGSFDRIKQEAIQQLLAE